MAPAADKLPAGPAAAGPTASPFDALPRRHRALARLAIGDADVWVVARSATRADVGSWLGPSRVWVFALADELVLIAPARGTIAWLRGLFGRDGAATENRRAGLGARPIVARIPFARLAGSTYNHVTGELVLAPAVANDRDWAALSRPHAALCGLKLDPVTAMRILARIRGADPPSRTGDTPSPPASPEDSHD